MNDTDNKLDRLLAHAAAEETPQPDVLAAVRGRIALEQSRSAGTGRMWQLAGALAMLAGLASMLSILPLAQGLADPLSQLAMVALGR